MHCGGGVRCCCCGVCYGPGPVGERRKGSFLDVCKLASAFEVAKEGWKFFEAFGGELVHLCGIVHTAHVWCELYKLDNVPFEFERIVQVFHLVPRPVSDADDQDLDGELGGVADGLEGFAIVRDLSVGDDDEHVELARLVDLGHGKLDRAGEACGS